MDSLEIYFDIKHLYYHGPKKALRFMKNNDPGAFDAYFCALKELNRDKLAQWIEALKDMKDGKRDE